MIRSISITDEIWDSRGQRYEESITKWPSVMEPNIKYVLGALNLSKTDHILEFSAGSGFLTLPLAERLTLGRIEAQDVSKVMLGYLENKITDKNLNNISINHCDSPDLKGFESAAYDKIVTLGGFHHVPDQITVAKAFHRCLKPGGKAVIADFADSSNTQRHFDITVEKFSSTGHSCLFISPSRCENLAKFAKFVDVEVFELNIPWVFDSETDIGEFFRLHHDLQGIDDGAVYSAVKEHLGVLKVNAHYEVPLQYCISVMTKGL